MAQQAKQIQHVAYLRVVVNKKKISQMGESSRACTEIKMVQMGYKGSHCTLTPVEESMRCGIYEVLDQYFQKC